MALWPLSQRFFKAPVSIFLPVSRRVFSREFWVSTPLAAVTELLVLGPILWLVAHYRSSRDSSPVANNDAGQVARADDDAGPRTARVSTDQPTSGAHLC
jgi:hypothetical protein